MTENGVDGCLGIHFRTIRILAFYCSEERKENVITYECVITHTSFGWSENVGENNQCIYNPPIFCDELAACIFILEVELVIRVIPSHIHTVLKSATKESQL